MYGPTRRISGRDLGFWLPAAGLWASLFCAVLVLVLTGATGAWDRSTDLALHARLGVSDFGFFQAASTVGGPEVRTVLVILGAGVLALRHRYVEAALPVLAVGGGGLVDTLVKDVVARPRPHLFAGALRIDGPSFPSGHTTGTVLLCGCAAYLIWRLSRRWDLTAMAAVAGTLACLLVGLSRLGLGVHYPSDVMAGFLLGMAWLCLSVAIVEGPVARYLKQRSPVEKPKAVMRRYG